MAVVYAMACVAIAFAVHEMVRGAPAKARAHWIREQDAQPDRDRNESYHFQLMDDKAYDSAKSNDAFWSWVTKACPKAAPRTHTVKTRKGGGGT